MPGNYRNVLKTLLVSTEQQIVEFELRLRAANDGTERASFIDALAKLHITHKNLKALLTGDDPAINS